MSDPTSHAVVAPSEYERNKAAIASYRAYLDSYENMNEQGLKNHEDLERMERALEEKIRLGEEAKHALEVLQRSKAALRLPNQIAPAAESSRTPLAPVIIPSIQPTISSTHTSAYIEELPNHDQRRSPVVNTSYPQYLANQSAQTQPQHRRQFYQATQSHQPHYMATEQHPQQQYLNNQAQQQQYQNNQAQQQQYQNNQAQQQQYQNNQAQQQHYLNTQLQQQQYQGAQPHQQQQQQPTTTPDYYAAQAHLKNAIDKGHISQTSAVLQLQQHITSRANSAAVSQPGPSNQPGQGMSANIHSEQSRQQQQHQRNELQRNATVVNIPNKQTHGPSQTLQHPYAAQNVRPNGQPETGNRTGHTFQLMQQHLQEWNSLTEAQKQTVMSNVIRDKGIPASVATGSNKGGRVESRVDGTYPRPIGVQASTSGLSTSTNTTVSRTAVPVPQAPAGPSSQATVVVNKPSEPSLHPGVAPASGVAQPSISTSHTAATPTTRSENHPLSPSSNTGSMSVGSPSSSRTPKQASKSRLAHDILRALKRPRTEDISSAPQPEPKRHALEAAVQFTPAVSNTAIPTKLVPIPTPSTLPATVSSHTPTTQNLVSQYNTQPKTSYYPSQSLVFIAHPQSQNNSGNLQPTVVQSQSQPQPQSQQPQTQQTQVDLEQQHNSIQNIMKSIDLRTAPRAGTQYIPYSVPSRPAASVVLDPARRQVIGQANTGAGTGARVSEPSRIAITVPPTAPVVLPTAVGNTVAATKSQLASTSSIVTTPAASSSPEAAMLDSVDQEMEVEQGHLVIDDEPGPSTKASPKKTASPKKPLFLSPLSSPERQFTPARKDKGKAIVTTTSSISSTKNTSKMVFECVLVPLPPPHLRKWKAQQKQKGKAVDDELDSIERSDDGYFGSGSDVRMGSPPLFLPGSRSRSLSASEFMNSKVNGGYDIDEEEEVLEDMNIMDSSFGAVDDTEREMIVEHCSRLRQSLCRWRECEAVLNCPEALLKHIHAAHRPERVTSASPWTCRWANCGYTVVSGKGLRHHVERHAIYPLYCAYKGCGESARNTRQLIKHIVNDHVSGQDVLRPTAQPTLVSSQSLEVLPPVPKILPSYMTEYRAVRPASISKTRHESIMPGFLKEISGNVPAQLQRYNAAQPMPMTPSGRLLARMNTPYSFVELGTAKYSSWPSSPAKLKNVQDVNSGYVTRLFENGLVLWSELESKEAVLDEDLDRLDILNKEEGEEEAEEEDKVLQGEGLGFDVFGPTIDINPGLKTAKENSQIVNGAATGGSGVTRREPSSTGDEETAVEMMLTTH